MKSGGDEHHITDKQLVPLVERSWLPLVLNGLDHVLGVEALQTRHLITCIITLSRCPFHGLLHLQCFELVLERMEYLFDGVEVRQSCCRSLIEFLVRYYGPSLSR